MGRRENSPGRTRDSASRESDGGSAASRREPVAALRRPKVRQGWPTGQTQTLGVQTEGFDSPARKAAEDRRRAGEEPQEKELNGRQCPSSSTDRRIARPAGAL